MIIDEIADKAFLTDKVAQSFSCLKCPTNLCTDTDTSPIWLLSEIGHHIFVRLFFHRSAVMGTYPLSQTQEEETIKIINLRDRPDGRPGIVCDSFLLDADSRCQSSDFFYFCLLAHAADKHTGVGRERLEVATLSFVAEGGKRKG